MILRDVQDNPGETLGWCQNNSGKPQTWNRRSWTLFFQHNEDLRSNGKIQGNCAATLDNPVEKWDKPRIKWEDPKTGNRGGWTPFFEAGWDLRVNGKLGDNPRKKKWGIMGEIWANSWIILGRGTKKEGLGGLYPLFETWQDLMLTRENCGILEKNGIISRKIQDKHEKNLGEYQGKLG